MKPGGPLKRGKGLRRDTDGARRFAQKRSRLPRRSVAAIADRDREAEVREIVFRRDGHRCVLTNWQGVIPTEPAGANHLHIHAPVPMCGGRLTFGHRRKAGAAGAYVPANGLTLCARHNGWCEDEPDAARALGGETPWWLCVREGDPCWEELGRRANGVR